MKFHTIPRTFSDTTQPQSIGMVLLRRRFRAESLLSISIQALSSLVLLICCNLIFAQTKELSREEWFSNLLKDVGESICSQQEFKKCHDLTEAQCLNRVQSMMLECYGDEIENIPTIIKDPEAAVAVVSKLGKCFEPKFSDDIKDYRRKTEECKIPESEDKDPESVPREEEPIELSTETTEPNG